MRKESWMPDRLYRRFYGMRKHPAKWACGRFEHVERYTHTHTDFGREHGLHSKQFLSPLMRHWNVPMKYKDI